MERITVYVTVFIPLENSDGVTQNRNAFYSVLRIFQNAPEPTAITRPDHIMDCLLLISSTETFVQ